MDEATRLALASAQLAPLACAGMKASLNEMASGAYDETTGWQREQRCLRSSDLQEGLAALHQRRAPEFHGA